MSDSENTTSGAPARAPRSMSVDVLGLVAVVAGVFVLLAWAGMIVGAFAGFDQHAVRQASDFLLVVVALAAAAALVARWKTGLVAVLAALAFAGAWRYVGWGLTYAGDALFYSVAAAFYLLPIVVAVAAILAGRSRMRARKDAVVTRGSVPPDAAAPDVEAPDAVAPEASQPDVALPSNGGPAE